MRVWLLWGMNIYTVFFSLYLLILHWGFPALFLLFLGPLAAILCPLLVWLILDDSLYILLLTLGNIVGFSVLIIPAMIDDVLPLNKIVSWVRFLVVSIFAVVIVSQTFAFIAAISAATMNDGLPSLLDYFIAISGGAVGGYYLIAFNQETRFEDFVTKKMLYSLAVPVNLMMIVGNSEILAIYTLNSAVCLVSSVLFIKYSEFS